MPIRVFSKRHPMAAKTVDLTPAVRNRMWYTIEECDPHNRGEASDYEQSWTLRFDGLSDRLRKEHGWEELRSYKAYPKHKVLYSTKEFMQQGVPRFVLDACELFHDLLAEDKGRGQDSRADPIRYQTKLNIVFEDANLPWRMLDGRILQVDSKWLEEEIYARDVELLSVRGFEGALAEFRQARSDLSSGDYKGAIHAANLALESTIKGIVGVGQAKPGELFRRLIDSGIVPDYHGGFLKAFEEHVLRSVATARNFEKGVGHGQGTEVNEPPKSLAELAVNLSGVLILFLLKRHFESRPDEAQQAPGAETPNNEIPF